MRFPFDKLLFFLFRIRGSDWRVDFSRILSMHKKRIHRSFQARDSIIRYRISLRTWKLTLFPLLLTRPYGFGFI